MASLADQEVIASESFLPVVTRHTTEGSWRSVVIKRQRRTDLKSLRYSRSYPVTFITTQSFLFVVLRMTEANPKGRSRLACSGITTRFMTKTARRNLLIARFSLRTVALITGDMRVEAGRNRHRHSAASRPMTCDASPAVHPHVPRVVESHVETAEPRKWFQNSRLRVAVADRADRIS
jgi:hypothetical protein